LTLALIGMQQITGLVSPTLMLNDQSNVDWPQIAEVKSIYCNTPLDTYTYIDVILYTEYILE
jgi:hypothetical protein